MAFFHVQVIAIDCGVVYKLCRLLCRDPSCHIIAIILVNLSFADTELRKQLVSSSKIELMDALSYSLWVACATPEEQLCRIPLEMDNIFLSPREILKQAMEQEYKYEEESSELYKVLNDRFFDTSRLLYPETARWCLCALKNLTRPAKDTAVAARELCRTGIVPLILRIITIAKIISDEYVDYEINSRNSSFLSIDEDSLGNMETLEPQYGNLPCTWLANSIQDVALFTILHLSAYQSVRNEILQMNIIQILSLIVDYPKNRFIENESNERAIANFQRLKARMALSYLLASEKHLGQQNDIFCTLRETESMLYVTAEEAELFVEVLSNVLHQRPKEGIGGYSAATFTIKGVIFSFRCLLTNFVNQRVFASVAGPNLNFLLFKAFALLMFGGQQTISFDAEMAEHLIFSLYLQSNLGFQETFLPSFVGTVKLVTLVKHVITAYIGLINITPAARFAANQILLRLDYLIFDGSTTDLVSNPDLDYELLSFIQKVPVPKQISGTKPISEIFDRPICRTKISNRSSKLLWKNSDEVEEFTNVLLAAQDISFCSLNHQDNINTHDVVEVANNVAITANREKSEYYNYLWCWKDEVLRIQCALPKNGSKSSRLLSCINGSTCNDDYEPFNIFGYQCGEI